MTDLEEDEEATAADPARDATTPGGAPAPSWRAKGKRAMGMYHEVRRQGGMGWCKESKLCTKEGARGCKKGAEGRLW